MKGTNLVTTIFGCGAAMCVAATPLLPPPYSIVSGVLGAMLGAGFAYFTKGKDVTGGSVQQ